MTTDKGKDKIPNRPIDPTPPSKGKGKGKKPGAPRSPPSRSPPIRVPAPVDSQPTPSIAAGATKCVYFSNMQLLQRLEKTAARTNTSVSSIVQQLTIGFLEGVDITDSSSRHIDVTCRVFL